MRFTPPFIAALLLAAAAPAYAAPFGTAFTYQGQLRDNAQPANGSYDLQFTPYALAGSGGAPLAAPVVVEDVSVANGVFTANVDFGAGFFVGDEVFLEIAVRPGASTGGFQQLLPRQAVSAVPYAQKVRAGSVSSIELASGAVTGPSLGPDAVGAAAIATNAVGAPEIADGSVGAAELGTNAVAADEIATGAVGSDEIGPAAVDTGELADGAVATAKIEDLAVTREKIANGAIGTNQVDTTQIQVRPAGSCPTGLPLLGFGSDGSVYCSNSSHTIAAGIQGDTGIALAMRTDNRPVVVFGSNVGLSILACDDELCLDGAVRQIVAGFDVQRTSSLVLAANNIAMTAYVNGATLTLDTCTTVACANGTPRSLVGGALQTRTAITLAGANPVIAYAGDSGGATQIRLFLCTASPTACSAGGSIRNLDVGSNLDGLALAVRPATSRPLVAYAIADGVGDDLLRLYDCTDASCSSGSIRALDGTTDSAGQDVSIAVRADGRPILAYGATGGLRLYDCADANCASGTIRLATVGGEKTSITIRADGRPLVSSYRNTAGIRTRLWDCADANCTTGTDRPIETVDAAGQLGTAVAVRSDGRPVVGYLSQSGARTRIHVCGRTDCAPPP